MQKVKNLAFEAVKILLATFSFLSLNLLMLVLAAAAFGSFVSPGISGLSSIPFILLCALILFYVGRRSWNIFSSQKIHKRILAAIASVVLFILPGFIIWTTASSVEVSAEFENSVESHVFSLSNWEVRELSIEAADTLVFWSQEDKLTVKEKSEYVLSYLTAAHLEYRLSRQELQRGLSVDEKEALMLLREEIKTKELRAQNILAEQLQEILKDEGIINPWNKTGIQFPPPSFRVTKPPRMLVVAHRGKLQEKTRIFIKPDISEQDIHKLEEDVDKMGYSSLVVGLGGVGTYPSIVIAGSPKRTIEVIAHEWIHNYMIFTPLGRTSKTTEQRILEETTASVVDVEIADKLWDRFYEPYLEKEGNDESKQIKITQQNTQDRINFSEEMRKIRLRVEELLSVGQVRQAERYMEFKRDWLEENGHYVRKLNQAYLTFYSFYATGTYKDANDGLGAKILRLRELTPSLKVFLETMSNITNVEQLEANLVKFESTYNKTP